jgi:anion-transporting  ArsA/GET3 family ATPase
MIPLQGLPRVVFLLGKGGVGRSTVAAALGSALAKRGERVLVFQWTLSEAIAPWFGLPQAGIAPCEVAPGFSVANFHLDDALRAFFVGHLGMGFFYRHVIDSRAVHRLVQAAPGIAEMMFLGHVCWLTTLAEKEAGLKFDRVLVDTPATGHGESLFDLPTTLASVHAAGLVGTEMARVGEMMRDPSRTGAIVVSLPEELAVEETLELVPRATKSLGRPLFAIVVNRSAARLVREEASHAWLEALRARTPPTIVTALEGVQAELSGRLRFERQLRAALQGATQHGVFALDEQLALGVDDSPRALVAALAFSLNADVEGAP